MKRPASGQKLASMDSTSRSGTGTTPASGRVTGDQGNAPLAVLPENHTAVPSGTMNGGAAAAEPLSNSVVTIESTAAGPGATYVAGTNSSQKETVDKPIATLDPNSPVRFLCSC